MKEISFEQMEKIEGGLDSATACGAGVGLAVFLPNPATIALALAVCLSGDS